DVALATSVGGDDATVDHELHEASEPVPRHLSFGAVSIEDAHPRGGNGGIRCEDEPIRADAKVAVAHPLRKLRPVAFQAARVDDDEVVAGAVQLRKFHVR